VSEMSRLEALGNIAPPVFVARAATANKGTLLEPRIRPQPWGCQPLQTFPCDDIYGNSASHDLSNALRKRLRFRRLRALNVGGVADP